MDVATAQPKESTNPRRAVPLWIRIAISAGLTVLLVVVGMGLKRAQEGTVQPGSQIPDFSLTFFRDYEFNGAPSIRLEDLRGKVVLVNFWASWCKPCEQEAAALEGAWRTYSSGEQVVFLGVDYVDTEPAARIFMKKFGSTYPNGPDVGTRISQLFRIKGVPETFIIDPQGVLRYVKIGPFASAAEIQAVIDPLITASEVGG
ncbi:MAG TPA: TlpA disulfide reductase family protein [Anaerolineales bacterium]